MGGAGGGEGGESACAWVPYICSNGKVRPAVVRNRENLDRFAVAGAQSSAEETAMARTTDSARFEGFVIAVNGCWDGYLRTGYVRPLDPGAMISHTDCVLFISGISPVFWTGGTEIYPPFSKDEKAGGRES